MCGEVGGGIGVKSCVDDGGERGTRAADQKCFVQGHPPGQPSRLSLPLTCRPGAGGTHRGCPRGAPGVQAGRVHSGGCSLVGWCSPGV